MRVLVTSARTPHALNAIRQFAEAGCEVFAADCTRLAPGLWSRFARRRLISPPMTERPGEYAEWLRRVVRDHRIELVFPCFEEIFVVARVADELRALGAAVLTPPFETMLRVHDKTTLAEVCDTAGLPCPKTYHPADAEDVRRVAAEIAFPAIIKLPDANNSLGLQIVGSAAELIERHEHVVRFLNLPPERRPVVQPKIEGRIVYTLALADAGRTLGVISYKPLMAFPDTGGTAFYRETVSEPAAEDAVRRLVAHLGWRGFIGIDVIIDASGTAWVIDANPRPTPAYQTGRAAGVDFTRMALEMAAGRSPEAAPSAKPGVRTKTLFVHLIWAAMGRTAGRSRAEHHALVRASFRERGFIPDIHRKDDLGPTLAMTLFVPWFIFVITPLKKADAGFCYSCNFTRATLKRLSDGR